MFQYFRIPRQLITDDRFKCISTDVKLLYGMLLDRVSLSAKMSGTTMMDGSTYYTIDEVCDDMVCGRDRAMKLLAKLDTNMGVDLVVRARQDQGKPAKLYVKEFTMRMIPPRQSGGPPTPNPEIDFPDMQKVL